jgi:hypothetical protein
MTSKQTWAFPCKELVLGGESYNKGYNKTSWSLKDEFLPKSSHDLRWYVPIFLIQGSPSQTKVWDFWCEIMFQQNVAWLEVPVYHTRAWILM